MSSLEGRRIPIGERIVTVKDVGKPGFVRIPREGKPDKVIWRNQKWRHPGIKPANVMGPAISRALLEDKQKVKEEIVRRINGTR